MINQFYPLRAKNIIELYNDTCYSNLYIDDLNSDLKLLKHNSGVTENSLDILAKNTERREKQIKISTENSKTLARWEGNERNEEVRKLLKKEKMRE